MNSDTENAIKKPKRPRKRVVVILFMLLCGMFLLGSGVGIYTWLSAIEDTTPEAVILRTKEIVEINIPDYFKPKEGVSVGMFSSLKNVVIYETAEENGVKGELMLTGLTGNMATIGDKMTQWIPSMRLYAEIYQNIDVESTKHETQTVHGENVDFKLRTGTHRRTGTPFRMMEGSFPARDGGTTYLYLQLPENNFDKGDILEMLRSIR